MPAKPDRQQVTLFFTPAQFKALQAAARQLGLNQSAFIRRALAQVMGTEWPDDMPARGKYKRNP